MKCPPFYLSNFSAVKTEGLPHQTSPSPQPSQNTCQPFAPRHHPCLLISALPVSHPHHPSPHTNILASLVKGEVLSPEKIRATTGGISTPPSLASHHHTCLPCQREVDWRQGTNLNIIAFTCDMSTLFILQTFLPSRRRDCHTTIPRFAPTPPKPHYTTRFS